MNTRIPILLIACWVASAHHLSAQSCTSLPHGPRELWLAAGVLETGGTLWKEVAFEASPGSKFAISFRRATGGSEKDTDLESWAARVGVPFSAQMASFCIFGGFELNDFSFVNRFAVDRGEADHLAREIGLRGDVPLTTLKGAEVRVWLAPAMTFLRLEVWGRTLLVDDQISTEERNFVKTEWRFSGQAGLNVRWKSLGISGGLASRPALTFGTLGFVKVGIGVGPNGSRSPGSI